MQTTQVSDEITVGSQPELSELEQLAQAGFESVVNLRPAEESRGNARAEAVRTQELGMTYVNLPVSPDTLDPVCVDDFCQKVTLLTKPVYVHCDSGARAGALAIMHQALRYGWRGDEAIRKARAMGLECDGERLRDFVRSYLDEHVS